MSDETEIGSAGAPDGRRHPEEVLANNHRYKPEPNFSKTGVGYLKTATPEDRVLEEARSVALAERLKQRAAEKAKRTNHGHSAPSKA